MVHALFKQNKKYIFYGCNLPVAHTHYTNMRMRSWTRMITLRLTCAQAQFHCRIQLSNKQTPAPTHRKRETHAYTFPLRNPGMFTMLVMKNLHLEWPNGCDNWTAHYLRWPLTARRRANAIKIRARPFIALAYTHTYICIYMCKSKRSTCNYGNWFI